MMMVFMTTIAFADIKVCDDDDIPPSTLLALSSLLEASRETPWMRQQRWNRMRIRKGGRGEGGGYYQEEEEGTKENEKK